MGPGEYGSELNGTTEIEENMMESRMGSDTSRVCELHTTFLLQPLRDNRIVREPGTGSFIRPLSSLQIRGQTFLCALINKYVEQPHGSDTRETVVLGSSNGAIQVEAVNLDKIRGKFSDLERLQEVSLDKEGVSQADPPGEIRKKCPNVRGVDLSYSLISSWDAVALIVVELPSLERLSLKYVLVYMRLTDTVHRLGVSNNRLQPLSNLKLGRDAFSHLTELQLNGTLMTWQAIMGVVCLMPRLQRVESGYNRLQSLSSLPQNHPELDIATLNLDSNQLSNWVETCQALVSFHKYSYHLTLCPLR